MACWKFWKIPSLCIILQFKGDSMENLWWLSQPCQKNPTKSTKCNEMLANPTQSDSIPSFFYPSNPFNATQSPFFEVNHQIQQKLRGLFAPPALRHMVHQPLRRRSCPPQGNTMKYRRLWRTWLPNRNPLVFIYSLL